MGATADFDPLVLGRPALGDYGVTVLFSDRIQEVQLNLRQAISGRDSNPVGRDVTRL